MGGMVGMVGVRIGTLIWIFDVWDGMMGGRIKHDGSLRELESINPLDEWMVI